LAGDAEAVWVIERSALVPVPAITVTKAFAEPKEPAYAAWRGKAVGKSADVV
jgi:hypothetical protein